MKKPTDLTVAILKEIRGEARKTNARLDQTNARLSSLEKRLVESELRTATALTDLAGTVRDMTAVFRAQADLRPRVEKCERDIESLKRLRLLKGRPGS